MKAYIEPFKKYIIFGGIAITNGVIIFPFMRKQYIKRFTNQAEVTHIVRLIDI